MQVSEMQRARLVAAAAASIAESDYAHTSVAHITSRARVSRRTFYDLFEDREECLLAVLEDVKGRISREIEAASLSGLVWHERVRGGLFVVLSFFDREAVLARVCVVQSLQGGSRVLAWREGIVRELAQILDQGRERSARSRECTVLTAEGLVGAAFAIVHARLRTNTKHSESLVSLLGELMSLIVLPYQGPAAARREQHRSLPAQPSLEHPAARGDAHGSFVQDDPLRGVPMRLTYRTARVLQAIATNPGASNRVIGEHADIHDQGQISKLLGRLQRLGLTANTGMGQAKGEPNAWSLTALGVRVAAHLGATDHTDTQTEQTPSHFSNHA
jgi:AcrR family transcriptional regulator